MEKIFTLFIAFILFASGFIAVPEKSDAELTNISNQLKNHPQISEIQLPFISNEGQFDKNIKYYARIFSGNLFVTQEGDIVYSIPQSGKDSKINGKTPDLKLKEKFIGETNMPSFKGELAKTKVSVFKGNDPSKWKKNINSYQQISLGEIYKGIEIKLKAYEDTIEKIFSIKPGSNPDAIMLKIEGAKNLNINEKGELEVLTEKDKIIFSKPIAYQIKNNQQQEKEYVQVSYIVVGNQYSFKAGNYDKNRELIIDPYVITKPIDSNKSGIHITAGTPLYNGVKIRGSGEDRAYAILTYFDGDINRVFVAGYSYSSDFPIDAFYGTPGTNDSDAFVAKLSENLDYFEHIVFIGGTADDFAYSIAMDSSQNVYIAGTTNSSNMPLPNANAYDKTNAGTDAFIAKLSYGLDDLISLTYLGGSSLDAINENSLLINGYDVVVAGYTNSTNFPTPDDYAYDRTHNGGEDVFIAILNTGLEGTPTPTPGLETLKSSTFIGGSGNERPFGLALRSGYNEYYVAGYTTSSDYPTTTGAYDEDFNGGTSDCFISRIMNLGYSPLESLASSTFLGGNGTDEIHGLKIGDSPDFYVYVTGNTNSSDFPGTCDHGNCGGTDVFIARFEPSLSNAYTPVFTKLGGTSSDYAKSIILNSGMVFVSGVTYSDNFPTTSNAFDQTFGGTHGTNSDGFVLRYDSSLTNFDASTYLGGSADDFAPAITSDSIENIYVAGSTNSTDFPTTSASFGIAGGNFEAFVSHFDDMLKGISCIYTFNPENITVSSAGGNFSINISTSSGCDWTAYSEDSWINITSGGGTGNGTINYTISANSGRVRKGSIYIQGKVFTIFQNGVNSARITNSSNGHQYQRFDLLRNFNGANSYCQSLGGYLATITSTSEQDFIYNNLVYGADMENELQECTIGAIQTACTPEPSCGWQWVSGETWGFTNWLGSEPDNTGGIENNIAMLEDGKWDDYYGNKLKSFICEFEQTFALTVSKTGTGSGTVTSNETTNPKINCGSVCGAVYNYGENVTLNAVADTNSVFTGWSGAGCSGTGSCTILMDSSKAVTAIFTKTKFTVTPIFDEHGTMTPSTPQLVDSGSTVQFTITPNSGYRILSVSGSCGGTLNGNIYTTYPVLEDCNVRVYFTTNTFNITASAGQGGSISPTSATVNYGETVEFTVTPDEGYHISSVTGCGVTKKTILAAGTKKKKKTKTTAASETYVTAPVTEACSVTATFAINTYTVTPSAGEHGTMTPSTPQTVNYNDTITFEIKADEGYHIVSVSGCNGTAYTAAKKKKKRKLQAVSEYTYTTGKITGDCTVEATFGINTYTVTPKANAHGSINPSTPQTVNYNDKISFTLTPDLHYHISSVTGCGGSLSENIYTTGNITGDCTVEATFGADTFEAVIQQTGGSGTITGSGISCEGTACSGSFEYGAKLVLKIKPDAGYRIKDIKINGVSIGSISVITIKQVLSNYNIEIIYEPV